MHCECSYCRYSVEGEAGHQAGILAARDKNTISIIEQIMAAWRKN